MSRCSDNKAGTTEPAANKIICDPVLRTNDSVLPPSDYPDQMSDWRESSVNGHWQYRFGVDAAIH
jgi:hypothetical protein